MDSNSHLQSMSLFDLLAAFLKTNFPEWKDQPDEMQNSVCRLTVLTVEILV